MKPSLHFTFHKLAQSIMSYEAVPKFTSVLKTNLNKLSFTADIKTS